MKSSIKKIAAQQAKFPELVGDILAHVGDRAIRTHDHLGVSSASTATPLPSFSSPASPALSPVSRFITQHPAFFPVLARWMAPRSFSC